MRTELAAIEEDDEEEVLRSVVEAKYAVDCLVMAQSILELCGSLDSQID